MATIKHLVDLDSLAKWQSEEKVVFASSSKEKKQLFCTLRGTYEVWVDKKLILETTHPYVAVSCYNEI
jgi:hypothetical protein